VVDEQLDTCVRATDAAIEEFKTNDRVEAKLSIDECPISKRV
jgi:hypothetical protein